MLYSGTVSKKEGFERNLVVWTNDNLTCMIKHNAELPSTENVRVILVLTYFHLKNPHSA